MSYRSSCNVGSCGWRSEVMGGITEVETALRNHKETVHDIVEYPDVPEVAKLGMPFPNASAGVMTEEELERRFGFHEATLEGPNATAPRHAELRNWWRTTAFQLDQQLPAGRYKSLVMTALEEASMWSHKSIANDS